MSKISDSLSCSFIANFLDKKSIKCFGISTLCDISLTISFACYVMLCGLSLRVI